MRYDYRPWYDMLEKPFFAPDPWVFGVAWGIIYPLIGIAFLYTLYLVWKGSVPRGLVLLFIANMLGNFAFTPVQAGLQSNTLAGLVILFVLGTLALFQYRIWKYSKLVFFLLLPYFLWGAFATALQLSITVLNF